TAVPPGEARGGTWTGGASGRPSSARAATPPRPGAARRCGGGSARAPRPICAVAARIPAARRSSPPSPPPGRAARPRARRGAPAAELYLRYYLKFPDGFDFGKGGKLPGLYGGPIGAESGGHHGAGFSTRYMWRDHEVTGSVSGCSRSAPCAEVYLYSPQSSHGYGQDLGGQWQWQGDRRRHTGRQPGDPTPRGITLWAGATPTRHRPGLP